MNTKLVEFEIKPESKLVNKSIIDANIPEDILVVMIKRSGKILHPKGKTIIYGGDILVLTGENFDNIDF